MEILYPSVGIFFWTLLSFLVVVFLLGKFAWKPIVKTLKQREEYISDTLAKSKKVEERVVQVEKEQQRLMKEAVAAKELLIKEAKEIKEQLIQEAKDKARLEADRIVNEGLDRVEHEQNAAMHRAKAEVVDIVIELTERLLKEHLSSKKEQTELLEKSLKELTK